MKRILVGLTPFFVLAHAQLGVQAQPGLVNRGGKDELGFTQLEIGSNSPVTEQGVTVIRNDDAFRAYLQKIKDTGVKRPPIDWTKYQVLAVNMTGMSSDGFGLRVKRLHKTSDGHYDIEFTIGGTEIFNGISPIHPNLAKKIQYPFALIETPIMDATWKVAVDQESDHDKD